MVDVEPSGLAANGLRKLAGEDPEASSGDTCTDRSPVCRLAGLSAVNLSAVSSEVGDTEVIQQCLRAAVEGPFLPDWEFSTLFGFERDEVRRIAGRWPRWDEEVEQAGAVNATLNNLLFYPHNRWDAWHEYVTPISSEVAAVYARWRGDEELDTSGSGYFDRLT